MTRMVLCPLHFGPVRAAALTGVLLLLCGCSSLQLIPTPVAPQLYVLRPNVTIPMGADVNWRLSIATPDAVASLDSSRIALTRSATTMDYFANAAWTDRVPLLVQRMLIQAFENSMRIVAVDRDSSGVEIDYLLETEVRNFEAHYDTPDSAPTIMVNIQAKIVRMPERVIVGSVNVAQTSTAASNSLEGVVLAFNQASGAAIAQIAAWTLEMPPPLPVPMAALP